MQGGHKGRPQDWSGRRGSGRGTAGKPVQWFSREGKGEAGQASRVSLGLASAGPRVWRLGICPWVMKAGADWWCVRA